MLHVTSRNAGSPPRARQPDQAPAQDSASAARARPQVPYLTVGVVDRVASAVPVAPPLPTLRGVIAAVPDSFAIGLPINAVGPLLLGLPYSVKVMAVYLALGTGFGATYFPTKELLKRLAAHAKDGRRGAPKVTVGPAERDVSGRFAGAKLLLAANLQELSGKPSEARRFTTSGSNALDTYFTRWLPAQDVKRLAAASSASIQRASEASGVEASKLKALVEGVRRSSTPEAQLKELSKFFSKTGVRGLSAVLEVIGASVLNAQSDLT